MSNSFLEPVPARRRGPIAIIIAAVAILVLAVGAVVFFVINSPGEPERDVTVQPTLSVPTGPLTLIKGTDAVEGVSVGYPHTAAGAVSAAAEYLTQVCSNLDPEKARTIGAVVSDASFGDAQDYFEQGPINTRRGRGLPERGPLPEGVTANFGPAAFQLRAASADEVTVLILAYYSTTTADGSLTSVIGVYPAEMRWDGTDWKLLRPGPMSKADYRQLAARPGSSDAVANGWQELLP